MKRGTLFLAAFCAAAVFLSGAAAAALPGEKSRAFPHPKKEVWDACLKLLAGLPVKTQDFGKGKIATGWLTREKNERHFLFLNTVADVKSRYFIAVSENQGRCLVRVSSRREIRKYAGMQGLRSQYLPSDGKSEQSFLDLLARELAAETEGAAK